MNSLKNFFNHFFLYAKLQTSMRGSDFVFDCNHLLHCKRNKINLNWGGSYIDCPNYIKIIKARINPIYKKDNKCFQYAVTETLNNEKTWGHPERITTIKAFINKYN